MRSLLIASGTVLALMAGLGLAPGSASAQTASILTLLEVEGRLEMGSETQGTLSSSDVLSTRDNYLDAWALEGRAGDEVVIDLISEGFDTYLYVVGPGLDGMLFDDDSGAGCNARIAFTFLENGTFSVVASSSVARQTGVYSLRVSASVAEPAYSCGGVNPLTLASLPTVGRTLEVGDVMFGQVTLGVDVIDGDRAAQAWTIDGRAGESVTITLESDSFDAYLFVIGPGISEPMTDDDSAGSGNSRLEIQFPADGTYTVVATVLSSGSGPYVLRVEEPLSLKSLDTAGRVVAVGGEVEGMLSGDDPIVVDGRRAQAWAIEGVPGQRVEIELSSTDFDSFLYLVGPGIGEPLSDDDGAGELNSLITYTFREAGTYLIIVSALSADAVGDFRLVVSGGGSGRWEEPVHRRRARRRAGQRAKDEGHNRPGDNQYHRHHAAAGDGVLSVHRL